jgi:tetratricopeptide (TPR) repeat protein
MEGRAVGLGTLLERTWTGFAHLVRPRTATDFFRQADQCRNEGRYDEAAELVTRGLTEVPDSRLGHLLKGYVHAARRQIEPARVAFSQVLTYDPYHPRALLGLARLSIEEGDLDGSSVFLDRALRCYPDFPEAQALRDLLETWTTAPDLGAPSAPPENLDVGSSVRDVLVSRADGTLVAVRVHTEHVDAVAQHMSRVIRMATATLRRAGLGDLRRGIIQADGSTVVVLSDTDLVLSATLDGHADATAALEQLGQLRARLAGAA